MITPEIKRTNRIREISEITRALTIMAKELDILVVCTVQIPEYEGKPTLKNLQESSIVQDADVIMFLHREPYHSNTPKTYDPNITELIVAKNRYGDTGTVKLKYNSETKQFMEMDD